MRFKAVWIAAFFLSVQAFASQMGRVTNNTAEVHQFPNSSSPVLSTLSKNTPLRLSSDVLRDVRGEYWYKTRMVSGEFGYVRAADVKGEQLDRELKLAGVAVPHGAVDESDAGELPWTFVVRVMATGGLLTQGSQLDLGGDVEGSMSVFLNSHGYLHRMLSVGPAIQVFSANEVALLGSIIFRLFSYSRVEPEVRVRLGDGLSSGNLLAGLNVGLRYPFSLDSNTLFCGYLEAGGLAAMTGSVPTHIFASAGIGYHF